MHIPSLIAERDQPLFPWPEVHEILLQISANSSQLRHMVQNLQPKQPQGGRIAQQDEAVFIQHKDSRVNGVNNAFIIFFFLRLALPGIHDQFLYPIQGCINEPILARNIIYGKTEGIV